MLEDLIPLMQTMVWPLLFAILIYFFRGWFKEIFELVKHRVEAGSEIRVGPGGLGSGPIDFRIAV
ncbi:MAG: hypothetical protein AAGA94_13415 [Pseudomonadota bacterium]